MIDFEIRRDRVLWIAGAAVLCSLPGVAQAQLAVQSQLTSGAPATVIAAQLAPGVTLGAVVSNADARAIGTFSGGGTVAGFELDQGVVLSSGGVEAVTALNDVEVPISFDWNRPGDATFETELAQLSEDAASLAFQFQCPAGASSIEVDYVFATEEDDFDGVVVLVDGVNVALLPSPPVQVTPFALWDLPALWRDNSVCNETCPFNLAADGFSVKLTAVAPLTPLPVLHDFRVVVADSGDDPVYDSWVFLQEFRCLGAAAEPVPTLGPFGLLGVTVGLLSTALMLLRGQRRWRRQLGA